VDAQLESYVQTHGIEPVFGAQERFLICLTPSSNAAAMIESGRRNKERFQGELFVIYMRQPNLAEKDKNRIQEYLQSAREAGAFTEVVESDDPIQAIIEFAHRKRITQIFIGHGSHQNWRARLLGDPILRLIRATEGIDVRVFPH
jgi:two-component system, OmpR family, sensor histidine kinase KdpD